MLLRGLLSMFPGKTNPKDLGKALALSQIGLEMVVPIVLGFALDSYLGWLPWATVVGAVLGMILGLTHLVQLTKKDTTKNDEANKP